MATRLKVHTFYVLSPVARSLPPHELAPSLEVDYHSISLENSHCTSVLVLYHVVTSQHRLQGPRWYLKSRGRPRLLRMEADAIAADEVFFMEAVLRKEGRKVTRAKGTGGPDELNGI